MVEPNDAHDDLPDEIVEDIRAGFVENGVAQEVRQTAGVRRPVACIHRGAAEADRVGA